MLPKEVFVGYQQGPDLGRAYASADIFFNPSITETFGNVTLEAMSCAVPAVCAKATGSTSLVEHEVSGLLGAPTAQGFASQLAILAQDRELREAYGAAALEKASAFTWDATLAKLVDNYFQAIDTYRSEGRHGQAEPPSAPSADRQQRRGAPA